MAFIIDRANEVASMLEKFTTSHSYQVAGQFANLKFWISEALHALDALAGYENRFERLSAAQSEWIDAHNVVVGSYCPMCKGQCEFDPDLKRPAAPTKIPSKERNNSVSRLKDAVYFFLLRCFRMNLIDENSLRDICNRVGTSVEARELVRK
jgi:hypothetical protein